ncbi:PH domain-containing protein [Modestobacter roseus]|uniref:PH domain-containing protein n=1 Tax=Modestobacter roseus TaxID=1181884 RepID=UPI0034DF8B9A
MSAPLPARDPAWPLSRSAIGLWTVQGALGVLFWAAAVAAFWLFVPLDAGGWVRLVRWAAVALLVVDLVLAVGVQPRLRWRVHRWEVTGEAVYTLTGWLNRTWTLVPISRIQTVDVNRGLLQTMFGLATVSVLTASSQGTVRIWHLEVDVARQVAEDLARRAEQVRDVAT